MPSSIASTNRADTAEFRRLMYFFQKLQEPRPRVLARRAQQHPSPEETEEASDDESDPVVMPRDLAPLVQNLATILERNPSATDDTFALPSRPTAPARPRSKTIAASPPRTTSKKDGSFGGKNFQFTFKMLLHKLYNAEDWASKVGALLADSQARFRPLTDTPPTPPPATSAFPTHNTPRRRAISQSRGGKYGTIGIGLGRPTGQMGAAPDNANGAARTTEPALKRRIVNRRRSAAEPELGKMNVQTSGWVYEAEVSRRQLGPQESIRRRKRVVSSVAYSEEQKEARRVSGDISPMLKRERAVQFADTRVMGKRSRIEED
ncbi:unnamed protein product [Peniophora sp. CBMAI 1063]|nr:unnamed protein product [Peniophora sp. CBMAI 1063]